MWVAATYKKKEEYTEKRVEEKWDKHEERRVRSLTLR